MHNAPAPVVWMLLAIGCGTAPARLDAGPAPTVSAAPVVDVAATAPAETATNALPTASAAATTVADSTPSVPSPAVDAADAGAPAADPCTGAALDLDDIESQHACRARGKAAPPSRELAIATAPSELRVAPGGHVDFAVVFSNHGSAPLTLDLEVGCGRFTLEAYTRAGQRADYINTTCGFGTGCGRGLVRVTLAPGGTLKKKLGYDATVTTLDGSCHEQPGGPLKPGKYELRIQTPAAGSDKAFDFRLVKTSLTVAP